MMTDDARPSCGMALGLPLHEMDTSRGNDRGRPGYPSQDRERFEKGPFATSPVGREVLRRVIPTLADNIRSALAVGNEIARPRGVEQVLRLLVPEALAFVAFHTLLNQAYDKCGRGYANSARGSLSTARPTPFSEAGPLRRRLAIPFFRRTRAPAATKRESGQPDSLP
jgi:hypothetical protein